MMERGASDVCSAFLSQEILTSLSSMPPGVQEIVLPCSVLAVQLSVLLPTAFVILFLTFRKRPANNQLPAFNFNLLILLFAIAVAYLLWMDIFFVGAFYDFAVGRRSRALRWLFNISAISQVAVIAMSGVIVITYRIGRALIAKRSP
jgi:hypothetical protein